jgi:hypothetical protein
MYKTENGRHTTARITAKLRTHAGCGQGLQMACKGRAVYQASVSNSLVHPTAVQPQAACASRKTLITLKPCSAPVAAAVAVVASGSCSLLVRFCCRFV